MITVIGGREYVKCELCKAYATQANAALLGWDWFTGTLGRTHHYCTKHARTDDRNAAFDKSRKERK